MFPPETILKIYKIQKEPLLETLTDRNQPVLVFLQRYLPEIQKEPLPETLAGRKAKALMFPPATPNT